MYDRKNLQIIKNNSQKNNLLLRMSAIRIYPHPAGVLAHLTGDADKRWSDRELAAENKMTAIQIKESESWPVMIRAR